MREFLALAARVDVVRRAVGVAVVVGTILVAINHGDLLWRWEIPAGRAARIALTYCVPYLVSTYSSVQAVRAQKSEFL